ncbi:MAG: membrane protein [Methylibium sp. NZG]|nr:MAG: membrane protein [Methylibium sp. NZG]
MSRIAGRGALLAALLGVSLGASALLAGCSLGPDKPTPKPLVEFTPQIAGKVVWQQRVDGVDFPLAVAVKDGVFTLAANDGTVVALQADTGREVWRASVGSKLSAGVGSDGRVAAVVTRNGELVALQAGRELWRKPMASRVTTAPLVAGERVFVLGVDRSVNAFDALDGRKLWTLQRPGDPLTLSQSGVIAAFKDTLVVGQGPRMAGVDPLRGTVRWEVPVATPRGTNEVERLADLVGPPTRFGNVICARAFQSAVGCVNAERGTLVWTKNTGGTDAVVVDDGYLFGADATDRLTAWRTATGEVAWTTDSLLYRGLSAPLSAGKTLVVGDAGGLVHWFSREKGEPLLRLPTDGSAVAAAPVASDLTMLVVTRRGGVFAFRPE